MKRKQQVVEQDSEGQELPHKYFEDQFDDESVLYVFHRHPIVMRKGLVFGLLGPLIGVLPSLHYLTTASYLIGIAAGSVLGLFIFAPYWISWNFSIFIVTDQRFIQITQKGLFHRAVADIALQQIQSINYEVAGLQQTLLGFGTIKMQTYLGDLTITDVHHPAKTQKTLVGILRDQGIASQQFAGRTANIDELRAANQLFNEEA